MLHRTRWLGSAVCTLPVRLLNSLYTNATDARLLINKHHLHMQREPARYIVCTLLGSVRHFVRKVVEKYSRYCENEMFMTHYNTILITPICGGKILIASKPETKDTFTRVYHQFAPSLTFCAPHPSLHHKQGTHAKHFHQAPSAKRAPFYL